VQDEEEPNDGPATAVRMGVVVPGDTARVRGRLDAGDRFDGWRVEIPVPTTLVLALETVADDDLDLLVDAIGGAALACESATPGAERCTVHVPGATTVDVVVVASPDSAGAPYELVLRTAPGAAAAPTLAAGPGAAPPVAITVATWRGEAPEIVPGEIVVQVAEPDRTPAARSRRSAATAVARTTVAVEEALAVAAAGGLELPPGTTVVTAAPSGTALVAVGPVAAARRGGEDARTATKRERAEPRARTEALAQRLAAEPGVRFAVPNAIARGTSRSATTTSSSASSTRAFATIIPTSPGACSPASTS
jgi:hypothetical protein